jgi:hypothetical protein
MRQSFTFININRESSVAVTRPLVPQLPLNRFKLSTTILILPDMSFARYLVLALATCLSLSMVTLVSATASPAPQVLGAVGSLTDNLPILNYPPQSIVTTDISPECANLNQGTRLCCESTLDGALPLLVELASVIGYRLAPGSINGIGCMFLPLQAFRACANSCRQERPCLREGHRSLLPGDYLRQVSLFISSLPLSMSSNLTRYHRPSPTSWALLSTARAYLSPRGLQQSVKMDHE